MRISLAALFLAAIVLGATALPALATGPNPNPRVLPINSKPHGITYGEWGARWWQWALAIPAATNPLLDPTGENCGQGQQGRVWYLAGTFFGGSATRSCTVPTGKALFFPILNIVGGNFPGENFSAAFWAEAIAPFIDAATVLEVHVDGVPLQGLFAYRAKSPAPFDVSLPAGDLFGIGPFTMTQTASDGFWIMLAPLSAGDHVIHIRGVSSGSVFGDIETEVTYHLTVK